MVFGGLSNVFAKEDALRGTILCRIYVDSALRRRLEWREARGRWLVLPSAGRFVYFGVKTDSFALAVRKFAAGD